MRIIVLVWELLSLIRKSCSNVVFESSRTFVHFAGWIFIAGHI